MFKVPIHFPFRALRRIPHQAPNVSPLQSCQAEILIHISSGAAILAWGIAQTEDFMRVTVTDVDQILPYTTLDLQIWTTSMAGGDAPSDWNIPVVVGDTATADAVAVAVAAAINSWVQIMMAFPDVASMRASPILTASGGPSVMWYLPWGMLENPSVSAAGPLGDEGTTTDGNIGVDNPFMIGIIQKRRHLMLARYPYRDDYYGDIPDIG